MYWTCVFLILLTAGNFFLAGFRKDNSKDMLMPPPPSVWIFRCQAALAIHRYPFIEHFRQLMWLPGFLPFSCGIVIWYVNRSACQRILVARYKDYLLKLQRQSSTSILTATFCHLVFWSTNINDVISTILIKKCAWKLILRFKKELFYPLVKV